MITKIIVVFVLMELIGMGIIALIVKMAKYGITLQKLVIALKTNIGMDFIVRLAQVDKYGIKILEAVLALQIITSMIINA